MREPKKPSKPHQPTEPSKPVETLKNQVIHLGDTSLPDSYVPMSFNELVKSIIPKNVDVYDPNVQVQVLHQACHDDYVGQVQFFKMGGSQPNPRFKKEMTAYNRAMKAYEQKLSTYNERMKEYEVKLAQYEIDHAVWKAEKDRKALPKLEAQIKDLTKKVMKIKETI